MIGKERVMVAVERERLMTAEEFFAFAALPENEDRWLELDNGVIVDVGLSSQVKTVTAARVGTFLNAHVIPNNLGFVSGADGGYKLGRLRGRRPDVGFIALARHARLDGVQFPVAPDLAVEVVSPDEDVFKKANEYLRAGTRLVWAVYTDERVVYVLRLNADGSVVSVPHGEDAVLVGGDVLPGFTLPVRDIFP